MVITTTEFHNYILYFCPKNPVETKYNSKTKLKRFEMNIISFSSFSSFLFQFENKISLKIAKAHFHLRLTKTEFWLLANGLTDTKVVPPCGVSFLLYHGATKKVDSTGKYKEHAQTDGQFWSIPQDTDPFEHSQLLTLRTTISVND